MICQNCNEFFIIKKSILTLFKEERSFLCDVCSKKNPINITINLLPIGNRVAKLISLFEEHKYINKEAFIIEYSALVDYLYKQDSDAFLLVVDVIKIDENFVETLDIIEELFDKNTMVVAFY